MFEAPDWRPGFSIGCSIFDPLIEPAKRFESSPDWPTLAELGDVFEEQGLRIRPVPQDAKPSRFEDHYEPRIHLRGELQTRERNWHDFFNAMVWLRFPHTKAELNHLHYRAAVQRAVGGNRSPIENLLTRFDECGAVLISADEEPLEQVRQHRWTELFWDQRERFDRSLRCFVFGHASFEKALTPYKGMTTNTLLIHEPALLQADWPTLDRALLDRWRQARQGDAPRLYPFPVLGVPGWYAANESADFYADRDYFRPLRPASR